MHATQYNLFHPNTLQNPHSKPVNHLTSPHLTLHLSRLHGMPINAQPKPPLGRLPNFEERNVHNDATRDDTPLPRETLVLKNVDVDLGNVDDGEGDEKAGDDGPEEETVVVDGLEDGERTGPAFVHVEETAVKVLDLPGGNQEEEAQSRERGSSGAEHAVTARAGILIAALRHVVVSLSRGSVVDKHESAQAERAHAASIDELIADEVLGENSRTKTARWATQNVRRSFFKT